LAVFGWGGAVRAWNAVAESPSGPLRQRRDDALVLAGGLGCHDNLRDITG
jgi:hypothetical protein